MYICLICNQKYQPDQIFNFEEYIIVRCPHCHTRASQPSVQNSTIFNDNYIDARKDYFNSTNRDYLEISALQKYLDVKNKKVLDIGCATGMLLNYLKPNNDILGFEVSEAYRPYLTKMEIPFVIGDLESSLKGVANNQFDLITMFDVFEHLENPRNIMELLWEKVTNGGCVVIWTNNYDDCISKFSALTYIITLGKMKHLLHESFNRDSGHNFNFVPSALEVLYKGFGFNILETFVADTPIRRLNGNFLFKLVLRQFYFLNFLLGKGKIVCHVLGKN
jgi:SAM-dependent methyltransferase